MSDSVKVNQHGGLASSMREAVKSYEQQLNVARHLASFKARARIKEAVLEGNYLEQIRIEEGLASIDPDPSLKRKDYVKRAAQALFMGLIFNGDASPITDDIRKELSAILGVEVEFTYPPGGRMKLAVRENGKARELTEDEQRLVIPELRRITSQKADTIMLGKNKQGEKK